MGKICHCLLLANLLHWVEEIVSYFAFCPILHIVETKLMFIK